MVGCMILLGSWNSQISTIIPQKKIPAISWPRTIDPILNHNETSLPIVDSTFALLVVRNQASPHVRLPITLCTIDFA